MFTVGESYMIKMLVGGEEISVQCKIVGAEDHLIKVQGRGGDEDERIFNTASRNFISAHRVNAPEPTVPFDLDQFSKNNPGL